MCVFGMIKKNIEIHQIINQSIWWIDHTLRVVKWWSTRSWSIFFLLLLMLLFRLVYYCHVLLLLLAPKTINQSVRNAFYYYYDYCVLQSILKSSQVTQIQSHVHASCCCSIMFALYIFSFFLFFFGHLRQFITMIILHILHTHTPTHPSSS